MRTTGTSSGLDKLKSVMRFYGSHSIGAFLLAVYACWAGGFLAPVQAEDWNPESDTSGTYSVLGRIGTHSIDNTHNVGWVAESYWL